MSLINIQNGQVTQTVEQKQRELVSQITGILNAELQGDLSVFNKIFNLIWNNPGLTAQEVFDGFGTDAGSLFIIAGAFETFINTLQPDALTVVAPKSYTIQDNGHVVVNN